MEVDIRLLLNYIQKVVIAKSINKSRQLNGTIELDIQNQALLMQSMYSLIDNNHVHIILDMQYVDYIDSSGLWAVFELHKKITEKKGVFVLIHINENIKRIFTRIAYYIHISESEQHAISIIEKIK